MWIRWMLGVACGAGVAFLTLTVGLGALLHYRIAPLSAVVEQELQRGPNPRMAEQTLRAVRRQVIFTEWVLLPVACFVGGVLAGAIVPSRGGFSGAVAALPTAIAVGLRARLRALPALLFALALAYVGGMLGNR